AGVTTRLISIVRGVWELLAAVPGPGWLGGKLAPFFIRIEGLPVLGSMLHEFMPGYYRFHDVALSSWVEYACQALAIDEHRKAFGATLWEQRPGVTTPDPVAVRSGTAPPAQHLEQRWYAGVHRDIGGGQPDNGQADRTRLW